MSIPRQTELMEKWDAEILSGIDSPDEATRKQALSEALSFAIYRELIKIRMLLEEDIGTEISDDDLDEGEE